MGRNGGGVRHGAAVKIVNAKFVVVADTFRESTAQFSISRHQIRFYTQTQMAMCSPRLTLGSAHGSTQRKRNEGDDQPACPQCVVQVRAPLLGSPIRRNRLRGPIWRCDY